MPIINQWDNTEKTVYLFIMYDEWDWSDYQANMRDGYEAIKTVSHKVDIIYAYVSGLPSGDAIHYLTLASEAQPANCYRSVIVNPKGEILQMMIGAVDNMRNWEGPKFVNTVDEARQYLIQAASENTTNR